MNNNQIFPFERNRYYVGKMLTSADFLAEQNYYNNKRQFINSMMFGSGIVCGLSVFNLDDLSIMVESGVAIDGYGREVVIDNGVVKKLSAIEGFESITTNNVSLCLRYKEENVHPVYSVNRQDNDEAYEYNRISEGYDLYLTDTDNIDNTYEMDSEFLTKAQLVTTDSYNVQVVMPATVCKGKPVKMVLVINKTGNENKKFRLKAVIQAPAFVGENGEHDIAIDTGDVRLFDGEKFQLEYILQAQNTVSSEANMVLKPNTFNAYIDNLTLEEPNNFHVRVNVSNITPQQLVTREIGKISLEMQNIAGVKDYIRLADFNLVRTDTAYIIDSISESKAKKYIATPAQYNLRNEYMSYFTKGVNAVIQNNNTHDMQNSNSAPYSDFQKPSIATGIVEIPLGDNMKRGDIRYSGEIMHGLGKGNVVVKVGYEYIYPDKSLGKDAKTTIYGNPDLFKNEAPPISNVETAVKVMNEKGSFCVAAKLLKETEFVMLTLRWVAIKSDITETNNLIDSYVGKSISAETTTVILGTKESYYFNVKFNNMEPCSVTYELTENASGEITSDGVYTAPAKEGVYEIRIFCTDMPIICTYAYAVVKKKGTEDSKDTKK